MFRFTAEFILKRSHLHVIILTVQCHLQLYIGLQRIKDYIQVSAESDDSKISCEIGIQTIPDPSNISQ